MFANLIAAVRSIRPVRRTWMTAEPIRMADDTSELLPAPLPVPAPVVAMDDKFLATAAALGIPTDQSLALTLERQLAS